MKRIVSVKLGYSATTRPWVKVLVKVTSANQIRPNFTRGLMKTNSCVKLVTHRSCGKGQASISVAAK